MKCEMDFYLGFLLIVKWTGIWQRRNSAYVRVENNVEEKLTKCSKFAVQIEFVLIIKVNRQKWFQRKNSEYAKDETLHLQFHPILRIILWSFGLKSQALKHAIV